MNSKLSILSLASVFLIGCDSSTPLAFGGQSVTDVTASDETVSPRDLFTFEDLLFPNIPQFLNQLRIQTDNFAQLGQTTYVYASTGEFTSSITVEAPTTESLDEAISQLFSVTNAANGEIRSLLLVRDQNDDDPNLTEAQAARLVELLNANGAGVTVNPNDLTEIVAVPNRLYTMTNTSTLEDRAGGIVAGIYGLESSSIRLVFNQVTSVDSEGNALQFHIPVPDDRVEPFEIFERGTFTLQLVNDFPL